MDGRWERRNNSAGYDYVALDDDASIVLELNPPTLTETLYFKKDSSISIKNGLIEYHDNDLL